MLIKWQESSCVHLPFRNSSWNVYLKVIKKCKYLVWLCFPQKSACALALEDAQNEPTEEFCCQAVFKWGQILVMFNSTSEIWPRWWWWTLFVHEIQQYKKGPKSERNHEVLIFLHSSDNFILMFCFCAQLEQIMLIFFFSLCCWPWLCKHKNLRCFFSFYLIHNLFLVFRLLKISVLTKSLLHCTNSCDKSVKIMWKHKSFNSENILFSCTEMVRMVSLNHYFLKQHFVKITPIIANVLKRFLDHLYFQIRHKQL